MDASGSSPYRVLIAGCGNAGRMHGQAIASYARCELVAGADLSGDALARFGEQFPGTKTGNDLAGLLQETKPHLVVIASATASHRAIFEEVMIHAPGVQGIMIEKPMATNLEDGRRMVDACAERDICLVVNHQRRRDPNYTTMRRLIDEGAIGKIKLIRATTAGDFMSDGTHLVDTVRYLLHDQPFAWIVGQIYRDPVGSPLGFDNLTFTGERFGHPVESGAMAIAQFENGVQVEFRTGKLMLPHSSYHDIVITGDQGELHACEGHLPVDLERRAPEGPWVSEALDPWPEPDLKRFHLGQAQNFKLMLEIIENGGEHPMSGLQGLRDLELVMGLYESARLHRRLAPPIDQPRFPLEIMLEEGTFPS
ncbi:MAG: Gfo/Idh/MocA family protein [Opitutales bacterium]